MKLFNTLILCAGLTLFTSCAHKSNHGCCSHKDHACQEAGKCKKDKSCCEDKCGNCDGKSSCSTGSCDLKKT